MQFKKPNERSHQVSLISRVILRMIMIASGTSPAQPEIPYLRIPRMAAAWAEPPRILFERFQEEMSRPLTED